MKKRNMIYLLLIACSIFAMAACGTSTSANNVQVVESGDMSISPERNTTTDSSQNEPFTGLSTESVIPITEAVLENSEDAPADPIEDGFIYHDPELVYPESYDFQMEGFSSSVIRENGINTDLLKKAVGDHAYEIQMDVTSCEYIKKIDGNFDSSATHAFVIRLNRDLNKDMTVIDTGKGYLLIYDRETFVSEMDDNIPSGDEMTQENITESITKANTFTLYDAPIIIDNIVPDRDAMLNDIQMFLESYGQDDVEAVFVTESLQTEELLSMTCTTGSFNFIVEIDSYSGSYRFALIE